MRCPDCQAPLVKSTRPFGVGWSCPSRHGIALGMAPVRRMADPATMAAIVRALDAAPAGRPCAACGKPSRAISVPDRSGEPIALTVCRTCQQVWIDPDGLARLPSAPPPTPAEPPLPAEAQARVAEVMVRRMGESAELEQGPPDDLVRRIAGLLGIPLELGAPCLQRTPWFTYSFAVVLVLTFILQAVTGLEGSIQTWGLIPDDAMRHGGLTWLTGILLHGDILHLALNVYMLLIVGDNVEDILGPLRTALLLFVGANAGDLLHCAFDPHPALPSVGASGGVMALMAYYVFALPNVQFKFNWMFVAWFNIPAYLCFLGWVALDLLGALTNTSGGVASFAHLGGAAFGYAGYWLTQKTVKRYRAETPGALPFV